jgi:hypothetical protein
MISTLTDCWFVAQADEEGTSISCDRFSGQTIPFSLFNPSKACSFQLILLMVYGKILMEKVSCGLFTGVIYSDVQPGNERGENV